MKTEGEKENERRGVEKEKEKVEKWKVILDINGIPMFLIPKITLTTQIWAKSKHKIIETSKCTKMHQSVVYNGKLDIF